AVGLALMWAFVIEGILPALIRALGIVRWLPEAAANAVLHGASPAVLPAGVALTVLAGYAAALAGAAAAFTARPALATAPGRPPGQATPGPSAGSSTATHPR